jgi:hypothetical protein
MAATSNIIDEEKWPSSYRKYADHGTEIIFIYLFRCCPIHQFLSPGPRKAGRWYRKCGIRPWKIYCRRGNVPQVFTKIPKKILQLSSPETALRETQKLFYAIDLTQSEFVPATDDSANLLKLSVKEAENNPSSGMWPQPMTRIRYLARRIQSAGKRIVTFAGVLQHNTFPLAEILSEILQIGQREMNTPLKLSLP